MSDAGNMTWLKPVVIATLLATHGLRKQSLSTSGAIAAAMVGYGIMSVDVEAFGVSLIAFYLIGSRATRVGKKVKANLEEGHHEAGNRNVWQVLSNSLPAVAAATLWAILFTPDSWQALTLGPLANGNVFNGIHQPYDRQIWCPVDPSVGQGWSRALSLAVLGHIACCAGDTLASELGILSPSPPRLITTLQPVPPGTNGAMTAWGTSVSLAGGGFIGATFAISLMGGNPVCRENTFWCLKLIVLGAAAGLIGSGIDSFLGATLQRTRYSNKSKLILQDRSPQQSDDDIKVISGWNILTSNQVNFISSALTAAILATWG